MPTARTTAPDASDFLDAESRYQTPELDTPGADNVRIPQEKTRLITGASREPMSVNERLRFLRTLLSRYYNIVLPHFQADCKKMSEDAHIFRLFYHDSHCRFYKKLLDK